MKNILKTTGFVLVVILLTGILFEATAFAKNNKDVIDSPGLNPGQIIGGVGILLLYIFWVLARRKKSNVVK
jgi:hypothetical protein